MDGIETVLEAVNRYNDVLYDFIIPAVFQALFVITSELKTEDKELVLLREPKDADYYEFSAKDDLVLTNRYPGFTPEQLKKSFHADTYCFDSIGRPLITAFVGRLLMQGGLPRRGWGVLLSTKNNPSGPSGHLPFHK